MKNIIKITVFVLIIFLVSPSYAFKSPKPISNILSWGYQIQSISEPGVSNTLVNSSYDMLVIEPTRTDWSSDDKNFDTHALVEALKNSDSSDPAFRKLVIAYIDIGEAEDWRWYWTWSTDWPKGSPKPADWPDYIVGHDPDGWEGNYPVAFWNANWKDIVIYGNNQPTNAQRNYSSIIDEVIKDGFDGIYLDWVEAFEDANVIAAATSAGKDPAVEMIAFINEMRTYATNYNPDFIIIQQNAASLCSGHPELFPAIDAIAQEGIWFEGKATDDWNKPDGYDIVNSSDIVNYYLNYLNQYKTAGVPVFDCEYALHHALEGYSNAYSKGYIPYCTRRSLGQLTTTPPPGYSVDTNNIVILNSAFTKYKDKKKIDVLKLEDVLPDGLEQYFQNNGTIGILNGDTLESFYWPQRLKSNKNGKVWKYKKKKDAIIKYSAQKNKLIFKSWQQMPTNRIIYIRP
ncbi:endo alpha-1,4 polygalactosaminidase [bacterium]|nr:endo alpha-1,4 polygalactosaminidase [bacterium]